jgi:hypothetical protein
MSIYIPLEPIKSFFPSQTGDLHNSIIMEMVGKS